jgi:hypothetical protein
MLNLNKIIIAFISFCLGSMTLFSSSIEHKKFDIETGMVLYSISGGGKLTEDVNLTIKGKGKLRFKEWGSIALIEEDLEEITYGAINNINKIQRCKKLENKRQLDVDFDNEKIQERKMPKGNFQKYITKDLIKKGQEEIAGHTCDIWEGYGVKKCIYKGIPLLVEHYLLGVYYQKKAIQVTFNIDNTASACTVPNYPVEKFALFKTNVKTKTVKLPEELSKILEFVSKDMNQKMTKNKISEDTLSPKQKRFWLDKIGQNIFEEQKEFLPKFLLSMKKARVCLQQADNRVQANSCVKDVIQLKAKLTKEKQNNIELWKGEEKNKILDQFDENIFLLESKMKCVRSSQNITDLSTCMKQ